VPWATNERRQQNDAMTDLRSQYSIIGSNCINDTLIQFSSYSSLIMTYPQQPLLFDMRPKIDNKCVEQSTKGSMLRPDECECTVLRCPRSKGWPHHGRNFSIYH